MKKTALASLLAFSLLAAACGNEEPGGGPDTPAETPTPGETARLLPLAVGAAWTYRITDGTTGEVTEKTTAVEAREAVGGEKADVEAFRVRTEKAEGWTISWQQDLGSAIVRHREMAYREDTTLKEEEYFLPSKLRIDETPSRLAAGASWEERYTEKRIDGDDGTVTTEDKVETWTVEAVDEEITVPAGTFTTVRVKREGSSSDGATIKTWWFAPGVGKVKEIGGQTEELVSYDVP